jgi:hypothetical protein
MSGEPASDYGARRAAYDIKKLRGKDMVRKIGASRRLRASTPRPTSPHCSGGPARKGKSGPYSPPALDPSPTPNYPIRRRSIRTTKTSASACTASLLNLGWPLRDRQFIFHPFG